MSHDVRDALRRAQESLQREPACPYHLVRRSIAIRVQDEVGGTPSLEDAEADLLRAHDLDSENVEVLEELAHFYDVVFPDKIKAKHFAELCRSNAARIVAAMDEILTD